MPSSFQTEVSVSELTADKLAQMTVAQVKDLAARMAADDRTLMALLEQDRRTGVRQLAVQLSRRLQRQQAEEARQQRLLELERRLWGRGLERVAGVDEVGRGCLAGPVVAAAVILPQDIDLPGLDDSKKLKAARREVLHDEIVARALAVGVGLVEAAEIDRINILQASLKAMRLALADLAIEPQQVLVDGNHCPASPYAEMPVVDGDARSLSIAAASVVAKVRRDRMMCAYDAEYPQYGFAAHKGYGSAEHVQALTAHGPCPLHRRSFGPVAELGPGYSEDFRIFKEGLASSHTAVELERMGHFIKEGSAALNAEELTALRRMYKARQRQFQAIGTRGEALAAEFLEGKGYKIIARGYRGAGGEIDLIAQLDGKLAFVEVKSSQTEDWGHPEARVNAKKRGHLIRAARHYVERHPQEKVEYRFDVVAITFTAEPEITHIENAFQAER
jgi:ribonuclease HII